MHDAPSVTYPVGRSFWAGALLAVVWLIGLGGLLGWAVRTQPAVLRVGAALVVLVAAGAGAARHGWQAALGSVVWDGERWRLPGTAEASASVEVVMDLQHALLLRACGGGWFWLEQRSAPALWDDLRRAVYSRAAPEALTGAGVSAAKP
jgi:hypothetical protein